MPKRKRPEPVETIPSTLLAGHSTPVTEPIGIPRETLTGVEIPDPYEDPENPTDDPVEFALGSDGTWFISGPAKSRDPRTVHHSRRIVVGVARGKTAHLGDGLVEMLRGTGPRLLGLEGRVYEVLSTTDAVIAAQRSGDPMFYGYSASQDEAQHLQQEINDASANAWSSYPKRPASSRKVSRRKRTP